MKTTLQSILVTFLLLAGLCVASAADKKHLGGPRGGRLLEKTEPNAEFYLEKNRTATITFYDAALKPVPATSQAVTVIANGKDGKARIEFEKKGDVLSFFEPFKQPRKSASAWPKLPVLLNCCCLIRSRITAPFGFFKVRACCSSQAR